MKSRSLLIVSAAVMVVDLVGNYGFAAGRPPREHHSKQVVRSADPPLGSRLDLAQLHEEMRQIAREEVSARISSAEKGAIDSATSAMKHNDATMSYVSWFNTMCLGLITLVTAGGVGVLLYGQWGILKSAQDTAEKAKNDTVAARDKTVESQGKVQQLEKDATSAADRIKAVDAATREALVNIGNYRLSPLVVESPVVSGGSPELPPAENVMQMEEADVLTVLEELRLERTGPLPPETIEKLAQAFVALGRYWRQIGNYPRAIARFRRATALRPDLWEGFEGLGRAFVELAQQRGRTPEGRARLLALAKDWCDKALTVGGHQTKIFCDLASIEDAKGHYHEAIELYKEAQKLDPKPERLEAYFNSACIYAKEFHMYAEALEDLRKIIELDNARELVGFDEDFKEMMNAPNFGEKLKALIG